MIQKIKLQGWPPLDIYLPWTSPKGPRCHMSSAPRWQMGRWSGNLHSRLEERLGLCTEITVKSIVWKVDLWRLESLFYLQNKEVRDAALQRMKHNCSSLGLEFGILYLTKDPA